MTIGIVGLGYVGLPLAVAFAEAGTNVVGVDVDAARVAALNEGRSPIEDIPDERLQGVLERCRFTTRYVELHEADAVLDTVLTTVVFTDIVDSTRKAAEVGTAGWKEIVEDHHAIARAFISRFRGREVDTAGDGFFCTFDGPARAIRCAKAISERVRSLGIEIRAGVHTGECEVIAGKVGGLGVVIGSRVAALARPSEVLVTQTVRDLVAGSELQFEVAGEHDLKGVPETWRVYRLHG
jgi:class 3 adenylate cyclase